MGVQVGEGNTQIIYSYARAAWTDAPATPPLVAVSGFVESPYRGLNSYDERDAAFFFGRESTCDEVLSRIANLAEAPSLMVSGVSGAGKSSLLRAGLLPKVRGEGLPGRPEAAGWPWLLMSPTASPIAELAIRFASITGLDPGELRRSLMTDPTDLRLVARQAAINATHPASAPGGNPRVILVVDQFEELFTQCRDESERRAFIAALNAAGTGSENSEPAAIVVIGVRADYEARCADYPELAAAVDHRYLVRAMTERQLRMAITEPARMRGGEIDDQVVQLLLSELTAPDKEIMSGGGRVRSIAGALPLLSHALDQAWRIRTDQIVTLTDYERTGGIEGAIGLTAQEVYLSLNAEQQAVAQRVFTRLTVTDPDGVDTADRVSRAELAQLSDAATVEAVLESFANKRLLVLDVDTVEISHETLLNAWPLLRDDWLAQSKADRMVRSRLGNVAAEWRRQDRDSSYLYSGSLLEIATAASARIAADREQPDLGAEESEFLAASSTAQRRRRRWRRSFIVAVTLLVIAVAVSALGVAQQRDLAISRQAIAMGRQLLAQANSVRASNPRTAIKLALAANAVDPGAETDAALFDQVLRSPIEATLAGHGSPVFSVAFSRYGQILATGSDDGSVILFDVVDPTKPVQIGEPLTGHRGAVLSVAFSPDGRTLATGSNDNTIILWNVTEPTKPVQIGEPLTGPRGAVLSVAFSPDGRTLATGSNDNTIILWDVNDPTKATQIGQPLRGHTYGVYTVAFSPDGRTLATGSNDNTIILWDVNDPTKPTQIGQPLEGHTYGVYTVAFSPDGRTLATGSNDNTIILWDVNDPTKPTQIGQPLSGHRGAVRSVAFSPDGHTLASGSNDNTIILWDVNDPTKPAQIGQPDAGHYGPVQSVAFSPDGRTLATGSNDNTIRLWNVTDPSRPTQIGDALSSHASAVFSVAFSPDGHTLATGGDDKVVLWNISEPTTPIQVHDLTDHTGGVYSVAFNPDGHTLATGSSDNTVILWDVTDPSKPARITDLTDHTGTVTSLAFSHDGRNLATGSLDTKVILWNVEDPTKPKRIGDLPNRLNNRAAPPIQSVAFSPDDRTLATGSNENTTILWDITDPAKPTQIGDPLTGHTAPVLSVAFSPDGKTLAAGSDDNTTILWNITDRSKPTRIGEPLVSDAGVVLSVAFSPNGRTLATGRHVSTAALWDLSGIAALRGALSSRSCSAADHGLSLDEWNRYVPELPYKDSCPPTGSSAAASSPAAAAETNGGTNGKIGVILPDTNTSARWETADRPFLEAAFKAAGVSYDIQNANGDADAMQTIADHMIEAGAKVLVIVNLGNGATIETKAAAAGVKTIDYERLTPGGSADYYVSFDTTEVGRLQGHGLDQCLGGGEKKIVYLNGSPDDPMSTAFSHGAHSILDTITDYDVVAQQAVPQWDNQHAYSIYGRIFTQHDGAIDGVVAANDGLANAVISVNKKNNLKIPVTGQDATVQGLQNILTGDQCMTVYKDVKKEADALSKVAIALTGGETPKITGRVKDTTGHHQVPILVAPQAITKANVKLVVDDGYITTADLCTATDASLQAVITSACAAAGITDQ